VKDRSNQKNNGMNSSSDPDREDNRNSDKEPSTSSGETKNDDDLDFVVTEKDEDDREFVGGQRAFPDKDDELGIEQPSDLMEKEALSAQDNPEPIPSSTNDFQPIGTTSPPPPPQPDHSDSPDDTSARAAEDQTSEETAGSHQDEVKKLSPEEVKSIEKNLYGSSSYLTDREKEKLISKMNKLEDPTENLQETASGKSDPADTSPDLKPDLPAPKMAKRGKGIAYFYRNYIQLVGGQKLHAEDEFAINNRFYQLKPKRFNTKAIIGAGALLFVLLLLLAGSQFVSNPSTDKGEIIGVVLDETGQPYVQKAMINFPELGKSIYSTPQGFFRSGPVPEGPQKIEYYAGDRLLKVDYATVVGGKITMLSLEPDETELALTGQDKIKEQPQQPLAQANSKLVQPEIAKATSKASKKKVTAKQTKSSARKQRDKGPGKITLAANVQGARFTLDGNVVGAGNLTYSKIKPGKHEYTVSKDGFRSASGTIKLEAGEDKTLRVDLAPMSQNAKAEVFSEEDFYHSGVAALKEGNLEAALADLSQAIDKRPSYAEAYLARAEVYTTTREKESAYNDYVRAAEIFQVKKDYNQAITAYNNAIKLNKKSVTAYLGRANTYLAKNEEIASIADYETVLKLDKRNAQAYYGLGEARFRQGRYKNASKHFKDARSLDSENPLVYQYLMLCYLAMDDIKKVRKSYDRYKAVASEEQMNQLRTDTRFSAVLRIVDSH